MPWFMLVNSECIFILTMHTAPSIIKTILFWIVTMPKLNQTLLSVLTTSSALALTALPAFANSYSTTHNFDVQSYAHIIYIQELESLHLFLTEDNIKQAQFNAKKDPRSTTVIAEGMEICVMNNNQNGLILNISPTSFGTVSQQDTGKQQDAMTNGDMLRFYNHDQDSHLPFFLRVSTNKKAKGSDLIGKNDDFTISGSQAPDGSLLYNLQAGVDGKIAHFDLDSDPSERYQDNGKGCRGGPILYNIEILNSDLAKARQGKYQTAFTINVKSIP